MFVVTVALLVPPFQAYSYLWPFGDECPPRPGLLLKVPLGPRHVPGCLLNADGAYRDDLRAVEHCSKDPLFPSSMIAFFEWTARYYHAHPGEVLATALPAAILSGARRVVAPEMVYAASASDTLPRGICMRRILEWLRGNGPATGAQLRARFPSGSVSLARLVAEGLVTKQGLSPNVAASPPSLPDVESLRLTHEQEIALAQVRTALAAETFAPFLLYGVTGSGKTEVYLEAVREARRRGGTALVMTPEIALTPQLVARFRERLGDGLVVLHSGLAEGARQAAWQAVQSGAADVVIGTRSAVFAPFERLALVVVDEEHDSSYKQGQGLRYNARDLALWRARNDGAVVLLGSATPSLGTFLRARQGKMGLLRLERRVGGRPLPEVKLVDRSGGKERGALSDELAAALEENLERGEQSLLLLNRRGFAPFLLCRDCGAVPRCPKCEISYTYYRRRNLLRCHYCDTTVPLPDVCPQCRGTQLIPCGAGTERLEDELAARFPQARIARMDSDTMARRGAHEQLVAQMRTGEVDILLGTQMIAKGHDFARVTLVGVLDADATLFLPDFRSTERAFALLTQVTGRAGRGMLPGRALIQTRNPGHYVFNCVLSHDYEAFFAEECRFRQEMGYPPFGYLVNLVVSGSREEQTADEAARLARAFAETALPEVEILGPVPCLLSHLRGKSRFQILLRAPRRTPLHQTLAALDQLRLPSAIHLVVDVDPIDMF